VCIGRPRHAANDSAPLARSALCQLRGAKELVRLPSGQMARLGYLDTHLPEVLSVLLTAMWVMAWLVLGQKAADHHPHQISGRGVEKTSPSRWRPWRWLGVGACFMLLSVACHEALHRPSLHDPEALSLHHSQFFDAGGVRVHFLLEHPPGMAMAEGGDGVPWLIHANHGLGASALSWEGVLHDLAVRVGGLAVAHDAPGKRVLALVGSLKDRC
jgi:hypothetical protein